MNWLAIAVTAVLCAVISCALTAYWLKQRVFPSLLDTLEKEFEERLAQASDVLGERVEQSVRKGWWMALLRWPARKCWMGQRGLSLKPEPSLLKSVWGGYLDVEQIVRAFMEEVYE